VDNLGEGYTLKAILDFLALSMDNRSIISDPKPEPVPPPKALNNKKP
jgi:hypothetical protein